MIYRGPIHPDGDRNDTLVTSIVRVQQMSITLVTGTGVNNSVYGTDGCFALPAYIAFSNNYEEWRVAALELTFTPITRGFSSAMSIQTGLNAVITPLWMVPFHEDTLPLSNQAVAANVGGHKKASVTEPMRMVVRMDEANEAAWKPTTQNVTNVFGVSLYVGATGMTVGGSALALGTLVVNYVVQFRKRRSYGASMAAVAAGEEKKEDGLVARASESVSEPAGTRTIGLAQQAPIKPSTDGDYFMVPKAMLSPPVLLRQ